jgi:multimeric flavodoxin WrbA
MSQLKNVLLLTGSPKGEKSNSYALGKFLVERLEAKGLKSEEVFAPRLVLTNGGSEKLLKAVDDADVIVFSTPLYVDSIPALTIKALELIHEHRKTVPPTKAQLWVAIMNSGFPEKEQMDTAMAIVKNFVQESNFKWGGGIRVGWGSAINEEPLDEKKGMTRKLTRGLSMASSDLYNGNPISDEAEKLASAPFLPLFLEKIMIRLFINRYLWDKQAKDNKVKDKMHDRPYEISA